VCNDIRSILRIEGCDLFKRSIDRPNLFYQATTMHTASWRVPLLCLTQCIVSPLCIRHGMVEVPLLCR
jgi:superfamily II DNA helicase RecQ